MKILLTLLCTTFMLTPSVAQIHLGIKAGGHLPTAGMTLPGFIQVEQNGTQKALVATLGAGVDFNATIGYQLNDNVQLNMDIGYLSGFKGGFYQYADLTGTGTGPIAKVDVGFKGTFINVTPNIVVITSPKDFNMRPYARFGLHMGVSSVESNTKISLFQGQSVDKYSGGWTVGLAGGLGVLKPLNHKLNMTLELAAKTITARPKQVENLESFKDQPKAPTVKFVKEIKANGPANEDLTFPIPLSSIGLTVGIQHKLGTK